MLDVPIVSVYDDDGIPELTTAFLVRVNADYGDCGRTRPAGLRN